MTYSVMQGTSKDQHRQNAPASGANPARRASRVNIGGSVYLDADCQIPALYAVMRGKVPVMRV